MIKIKGSELTPFFQRTLDLRDAVGSATRGIQDIMAFSYIRAIKRYPDDFEIWFSYITFLNDVLQSPKDAYEKLEVLKNRMGKFSFAQKIKIGLMESYFEGEIFSKNQENTNFTSYSNSLDINPFNRDFM